jgi:hypothetical protein
LARRNLLRIRNATLLAGVSFLAPFGAEAQTCTVTTGQPVQVNGASCTIPTGSIIDVNQLNTDSVLAQGGGGTITSLAPGSSVIARGGTSAAVMAQDSGVIIFNGGSATTTGDGTAAEASFGMAASRTNAQMLPGVLMSNGTTVTTTGATAPGVAAVNGGTVTLTGNSITTSGTGSYGLWAFSDIPGAVSQLTAENVKVTTLGSTAYGAYADPQNFSGSVKN